MLELLVTATVLLSAVLLIRGLLGSRLSAKARYALWGLVLLRLLLPVTFFHSPVSVMNAVPSEFPVRAAASRPVDRDGALARTWDAGAEAETPKAAVPTDEAQGQPAPVVNGPSQQLGKVEPPLAADGAAPVQTTPAPAPDLSRPAVLFAVWVTGAVLVGGWFLAVNVTFRRRLRRARRPVTGVVCPIPVYRADFLPSPCLAGVFRPAVYLNASALADPATLGHVLTHELCHKRHGDNLWALLRGLCLTLWWFHPLAWVSAVLSKRDCELFCDESAVKVLGERERIPYGKTLIRMVAAKRPGPGDLLCASTAMTEGRDQIKERVIRVATFRKMPKAALCACTVLALLAGLCTFTGAVVKSTQTAMPCAVQADPALTVAALDPKSVTVPDFSWVGTQGDYLGELGLKWAAEYGKQFYALPEGNPWRAADVQVVPPVFHQQFLMGLTGDSWGNAAGEEYQRAVFGDKSVPSNRAEISGAAGYVALAVKPVGGIDAVRDLFQGGVPRGTGALADYVLLEYYFDLDWDNGRWVTSDATPGWNRNPPPALQNWTDADMETWAQGLRIDIGSTVAGDDMAAWEQAGWEWAKLFTSQHRYLYDQGNPAKADDVQVLAMDLEVWEPNENPDTLFFHLKYAFRPVWGVQGVLRFMSEFLDGPGGNWTEEGPWKDYLIVDAAVTLTRDAEFQGEGTLWRGFELQGEYYQNYDNGMNLSTSFTVPKGQGSQTSDIRPVGVSVSYPAGTDETGMRDVVFGKWATAFAQQFYHLPEGHPLACSKVEATGFSSFHPTLVTTSGMARVSDGVTGDVGFWMWPKGGQSGAARALEGKAYLYVPEDEDWVSASWSVTLERSTAADGTVTWTCTAAAPDEGATSSTVSDVAATGEAIRLPCHVEPRAGWTISALDYDAVFVPDDGKGDLRTRWAIEFGREFYALPEGNPWKAGDVQVRWAGDNICLAMKPLGGTAALEPSFPNGCPKGSGDLEGYILLQYRASFRKETIPQFSDQPVWVAWHGYTGPLWASMPPVVGSETWQNKMDDARGGTWKKYRAGKYASGYGGNDSAEARSVAATDWVWDYLSQFVEFETYGSSAGYPLMSDDLKLISTQVSDYNTANQTMKLQFVFAFRPLWGTDVVEAFYGAPLTMGTGDLAGYVLRTQTATLEFRPAANGWSDHWVCIEMKG